MSERPWDQRSAPHGPPDHGAGPDYTYGAPAAPPAAAGPPSSYASAQPGHPPAYASGYPGAYPTGYPQAQPTAYASGYPGAAPSGSPYALSAGVQRPAVIGISASLAITGSLGFLVLLGFGVLLAVSILSTFSFTEQPEAAIYHLAERFQLYLTEGLGVPLVGFPLASTVSGFLLIARRPWARIVHTAVGVAALGWSGWWLRDHLAFWAPTTVYIALGVLILWVPSVGRWYAARERPRTAGTTLTDVSGPPVGRAGAHPGAHPGADPSGRPRV